MWSRRALVMASGLGLTACGTGAIPATEGVDVLVIGAGMAGITAARELRAQGAKVLVLEARDRVGGRIDTVNDWSGIPLDMGASWIHGAQDNPLTKLADKAKLKRIETTYDASALHIDPHLRKRGMTSAQSARWEKVIAAALKQSWKRDTDESMQAALDRVTGPMALDDKERAQLGFALNAGYVTEWGADPSELSSFTVDEGKYFAEEGVDTLFPGGYVDLVKWLGRGIRVETGIEVTRISVGADGVTVSGARGQRKASAAIITLPLGVLKSGRVELLPGLPSPMANAINTLDMGVLSKSFFRFEKAFWPSNIDWHEYLSAQPGRWGQWVSFAKAGAPVLLGFNGGSVGREIEAANPRDVVDEAFEVLKAIFGKAAQRPIAVKTTQWARDPLALGSYSINTVGSTRADRVALTKAVAPGVYLAGEATEPDYHSTVHGAHFSGKRAAKQVLAHLGR